MATLNLGRVKGADGATGAQGIQGPKGDKGDKGDGADVEVGGVNLLRDTDWRGLATLSSLWAGSPTVYQDGDVNYIKNDYNFNIYQQLYLKAGTYVLSFRAKQDNSNKIRILLFNTITTDTVIDYTNNANSDWTTYSYVFNNSGNGLCTFYIIAEDGVGNFVRYTDLKLERGNIATDWSPNPLDLPTKREIAKTIKAIATGDGLTAIFHVPHGLGQKPDYVMISPNSVGAASLDAHGEYNGGNGVFSSPEILRAPAVYVTANSTHVTIWYNKGNYDSIYGFYAPEDNLALEWTILVGTTGDIVDLSYNGN